MVDRRNVSPTKQSGYGNIRIKNGSSGSGFLTRVLNQLNAYDTVANNGHLLRIDVPTSPMWDSINARWLGYVTVSETIDSSNS